MNKLVLFLLVGLTLTINRAEAQNRVPYKLFNDFETGELYGWETYPYAQDIAFDALYYARKTPTYKNSKYALARPFKAHDTNELYQGFTKRLNLYTSADTRIKAAIYFQSDRNPESLELSLGTFDGKRYMHTITKPLANTWLELDLPISVFNLNGQALTPNEHIQVITIKGSYPIVNYLFTYTILMDDFQINGERDRSFTASEPVSTNFEMFETTILNKHFFYGDNINLRVAPEGNIALKQVKGTLVDSKGIIVKDNVSLKQNGSEWETGPVYKLNSKDVRGQWEFRVKAQDENGGDLSQSFRFLVPGNKISEHPRLFFSADELKTRLANEKSPVAKRILDHALEEKNFMKVNVDAIKEGVDRTAENLVGGPYARNSVGYNAYAEWNNPNGALGKVIEEGSFHYAFTGDKAAGEQAKKALLKLASFTKWNSDWMLERKFWTYYPVGYTIKPVAYGYDMLYDLLTEQERALVRNAIMEKGIKLFQRDMVEMNRMPSNQTNHIAVLVAGFGMAATAIYGDDPSNPYLEPYLSGIITKAKTFIDRTYYEDGSYGEPKSGYMNMATKDIVEMLAAIERNFGVDYTTTTNLPNYYKYPLQASASNGLLQDFGDGGGPQGIGVAFGPQVHAQWLVNRTKNPFLYHYVKPYWESGKGGFLGYLWYRDDITPSKREILPTSKVFSAQGMVMRSGWDEPATIITSRVGPNSNHYHYDQGSFQIITNGEALLTDPGVGYLGYYANLDYLGYNVNSIAHNVLLVDHDPESQAPAHYDNGIKALTDWPRMTHTFIGKNADALESDLATVYKDKLEKYTRTLLYTKTGPIFLFDQIKSKSSKGHVYDWLFHAPANDGNLSSITYKDRRMQIQRPNARLTMDVISPDIANSRIRDRFSNKTYSESFLSLETRQDLVSTNFFAVLLPEAKPSTGVYVSPATTRIDAPGWIGAKIVHGNGSDLGFFKTDHTGTTTAGDFTTDASRFTASFDKAGKFVKAYFEGSSFAGQSISVKALKPLTGTIAIDENNTEIEVETDDSNSLTVFASQKPGRVQLNGKATSAWSYNQESKSITVKVPAGKTQLWIGTAK
ncbi:DUF4962 domain-containing protein [Daejeonella lutea]|uniref:Heparinase II/III-like protein n=1 Tax=Daejeonella lutea TaxID=572036 RepID=A0A1T5AAN8_9SPHI|nr:DUF4962 domain-containing protein [Daejeonella lutea]SKB31980.1 Heparinase II/III-like protein [Daejeonella lutea]